MRNKIFGILAFIPDQQELVKKWCFDKCGKILIGIINDELISISMIPCKTEECPIEEKRIEYGYVDNEVLWIRKLKKEKKGGLKDGKEN